MHRIVVGLTGGLGTGKSTALAAFRRAGARVFCADELARRLSEPGRPLHRAIVRVFGARALDRKGRVDRAALAALVFPRPALRRRLERATHPPLLRVLREQVCRSRGPVVVVDAPLLFEAGLERHFHLTVTVSAPRAKALRRAMGRGLARSQALARMRAQWSLERKERLSDLVIDNAGSRADLKRAVKRICRALRLMAA